MHIFHMYRKVGTGTFDLHFTEDCPNCYGEHNHCPHGIQVCIKCGKFKAWGSHGRMSVIPSTCPAQLREYIEAFKKVKR